MSLSHLVLAPHLSSLCTWAPEVVHSCYRALIGRVASVPMLAFLWRPRVRLTSEPCAAVPNLGGR